ncbi:MAG TPA: hypothetical protein VMJ66_13420 [Geobacteraceae bacterium]|nr:hypothetical protein [Geobacteraceae bacterium]
MPTIGKTGPKPRPVIQLRVQAELRRPMLHGYADRPQAGDTVASQKKLDKIAEEH